MLVLNRERNREINSKIFNHQSDVVKSIYIGHEKTDYSGETKNNFFFG